jgi:hypothetical protein
VPIFKIITHFYWPGDEKQRSTGESNYVCSRLGSGLAGIFRSFDLKRVSLKIGRSSIVQHGDTIMNTAKASKRRKMASMHGLKIKIK